MTKNEEEDYLPQAELLDWFHEQALPTLRRPESVRDMMQDPDSGWTVPVQDSNSRMLTATPRKVVI